MQRNLTSSASVHYQILAKCLMEVPAKLRFNVLMPIEKMDRMAERLPCKRNGGRRVGHMQSAVDRNMLDKQLGHRL